MALDKAAFLQAQTAHANLATRPRRVAALGDSITANNHLGIGTSNITKSSRGYMTFAEVLSRRAWYWDETLNFGVAGQTSAQILARVPQVIAAAPGACVVLAGVNDGQGTILPLAQTKANLLAIWTQLAAAGILVVAMPILPASMWGATTLTASKIRYLQNVNNWIRETAQRIPNVILADPTAYLVDMNAGANLGCILGGQTGAVTSYAIDGLHPAQRGAFWTGYVIAQALAPAFNTPFCQSQQSPLDVYNATDNITGNRLNNAIMTATSGGTAGAGASGVVPAGFQLARSYGTVAAAAGSFVAKPLLNGQTLSAFRIAMTAPGGNSTRDSMVLAGSISVAPGETIYAEGDVDIGGITADSFLGMRLQIYGGNPVNIVSVLDPDTSPASYLMPNYAWSGTLRTPLMVVPAGLTALNVSLEVFLLGSVANAGVTVDVSRFVARSVV